MRCVRPIPIKSKHNVYTTDVPCGKCYACQSNRRNEWTFRLMNELRDAESGYFVTLTYDEEHLHKIEKWSRYKIPTLEKKDVQLFTKSLRAEILQNEEPGGRWIKQVEKSGNWAPKYRYFACGEYGSKGNRPHYHVLMYNLPQEYVEYDPIHKKKYSDYLEEIWGRGAVDIGDIEQKSAHYVAKYTLGDILNEWQDGDPREKPFAIMSRNPGIGINYVNKDTEMYYNRTGNSFATVENGQKQRLGRYYKDKIFKDEGLKKRAEDSARMYAFEQERREREHLKKCGISWEEAQEQKHKAAIKEIKRTNKKNLL